MRGYLARQLAREAAGIARDRDGAARLASETASLKAEVEKLKSQVGRVTQLESCGGMCSCHDIIQWHHVSKRRAG